ncbi:MAG: hypothetical protein C4548_06375 [Desulfobacteraceae bacterium]|nr:MAG: hypothetical protein C4548_06375 [Desulfobacteraceae bacterium]
MSQNYEEQRALIWNREQIFAYELATLLIQKPKVTVWMLMLPLLFLFFMQDLKKYKAGIRGFADGFLENKRIALDLAFKALRDGAFLGRVLEDFAAGSRSESAGHSDLVESQLGEVAFLAAHYQRLMMEKGLSYEALVQKAYGTAGQYHQFLDKLFDLEDAVLEAAFQVQEPDADGRALAGKMRSAARRMRREAGDRIFQA